ncbi:MAG: Gfo/Idh/MocA family oxidoreductase [Chitinophagales bacterium]|nr:Gfo/Idh/MocA family oxidoreductase [Chitinophagales bacterium]
MDKVNWGIIGCGDVTEIKSGPAFGKVPGSALVAVMRRNAARAEDYARRHQVPKWYSDAAQLIHDPDVNAIYIATPPSSHETYALEAIAAGKPVYVEKPMSLNYESAKRMTDAAASRGNKLSVAHYRRGWPMFNTMKQQLDEQVIGEVVAAHIQFDRLPLGAKELADEKKAWRVNPAISGGGLFHDLAPHQLDIMYWLFGEANLVHGRSSNLGGHYQADDTVNGHIEFANGVHFTGNWNFNAGSYQDQCEIIGSKGRLRFRFFDRPGITKIIGNQTTRIEFDPLPHVQQPMIERVVQYFLGNEANPCRGEEAATVMHWIDHMTFH